MKILIRTGTGAADNLCHQPHQLLLLLARQPPRLAHDPQVDAVTETDVRAFFNHLKDDRTATLGHYE
ncbi:hypothetical protein ACW180_00825 [Limosilactobacillus fermentum]